MDEKVRSRVERFGIGCVFKLMRIFELDFYISIGKQNGLHCNGSVIIVWQKKKRRQSLGRGAKR